MFLRDTTVKNGTKNISYYVFHNKIHINVFYTWLLKENLEMSTVRERHRTKRTA